MEFRGACSGVRCIPPNTTRCVGWDVGGCVCVLGGEGCGGCVDHNVIFPVLATTYFNNLAIRISVTSEYGWV